MSASGRISARSCSRGRRRSSKRPGRRWPISRQRTRIIPTLPTARPVKIYAEFAKIGIEDARRVREEFDPKEMVIPDRVVGLSDLMSDAGELISSRAMADNNGIAA